MLTVLDQVADDLTIWRAFRSRRRITIASDRGLRKGVGVFAWKIVTKDRSGVTTELFEGSGPVDGPQDIATSTRSELGGLVAPLLLCTSLAAFWGLRHRCRYRWVTDSKAAISRVEFITRPSRRIPQMPEDVDYMTAIRELQKSLGTRLKTSWVKGHQDERGSYDNLPDDAKLNVDVDAMATAHLYGTKNLPSHHTPHTPWLRVSIKINGRRYPSQIDAQLRFHINGSYLKQHLQSRQGWSEETWHKIDIHSFGRFFRNLTPQKQVQQMKFVHNLHATGERKAVLSPGSQSAAVSTCPCCQISLETQHHFVHCRKNGTREETVQKLRKNMKKMSSNQFGMILADVLDQWMTEPSILPSFEKCRDPKLHYDQFPLEYQLLIHQAIKDQGEIGWLNMLWGFLAKSWCTLASTHISSRTASPVLRDDGQFRISRTLRHLHTAVTELWHTRNETLHATKMATEDSIRTVKDSEIVKLYREKALIPVSDQHYCATDLKRLLHSRPSYKRRWIHRVKSARARLAHENATQPILTRYFATLHLQDHIQKRALTLDARNKQREDDDVRRRSRIRHQNTTQQLLTKFLKERAPNSSPPSTLPQRSPTPD